MKNKKEEIKMEFSKNLSKIMQEQHLTQMGLANMIGLRQSQVSNWLRGKSEPCMYAIMMLGSKLKVSTDELLGMDRFHGQVCF